MQFSYLFTTRRKFYFVTDDVVFSKRQRITWRLLNAIAIPSVVCLSVVCDVGATVHPTQAVELFGNFFHHMLMLMVPKIVGGGRPFPPEICVQSDPPPCQTAQFRPISAHSASTVIASEKSSISAYKKSTTRFPTSHRSTVYVTPTSVSYTHLTLPTIYSV